jgi:uncharacterized Zn-binding protein involved in type VI secretion
MPGAVRLTDICTGHGCWPPRPNSSASSDVIINGLGAHRVGDGWLPHTCPAIPETHASSQASGSPDVITNGSPQARIGDSIACGSSNATGSSDVIVN